MKTLFISDLDGTLLTSKETISAFSLENLNKLIDEEGMLFTYATARSLNSAAKACWGLRQNLPVILYNGAVVMEPWSRRMLYNNHFNREQRAFLRGLIDGAGLFPLVYSFSKEGKERVSWIRGKETEGIRRYLSRRTGDSRLNPIESPDELCEDEIFYYTCIAEKSVTDPLNAAILQREDLKTIYEQETYHTDYWCEIMPRGTSKGAAAERLARELGADKMVVFGDAPNDAEMFCAASESYAVRNADERLKQIATGEIGYSEEDSVAKFLMENLARYH